MAEIKPDAIRIDVYFPKVPVVGTRYISRGRKESGR